MSVALMATASVSFTACHDDDDYEDIYVIDGPQKGEIQFTSDTIRVKIGEANRVALPIASATGEVKAFSLDPEVANVVDVNGTPMIEGFKNGFVGVMVSDADNNYKRLDVSVYTTDVMEFESNNITVAALMGYEDDVTFKVTLGNGGYTATSDSDDVTFVSATEDGDITMKALGKAQPYSVQVTVTDASNVKGTVTLTVTPKMNPFDQAELDRLCALTESETYTNGVHDDHLLNEHEPYYWMYAAWGYGTWFDDQWEGQHRFGWWYSSFPGGYGGTVALYPETAQVGQEVEGSWRFQYSNIQWWPLHEYTGTVKVVKDDAASKVVVFYGKAANYDVINYGYIVQAK